MLVLYALVRLGDMREIRYFMGFLEQLNTESAYLDNEIDSLFVFTSVWNAT